VVPKKGGMMIVENNNNELIPQWTVTGWRMCIDYRKLNATTKKDHFPLVYTKLWRGIQRLEASKITLSGNWFDENRYQLIWVWFQNRLFYKMTSTNDVCGLYLASIRRDMSDSTRGERLGSKLSLKLESFLLFQEL
jgi:hypothetical protein